MNGSQLPSSTFDHFVEVAVSSPEFQEWLTRVNQEKCLGKELHSYNQKEVDAIVYTDKQRSNVLFTLKQSAFDNPTMQELAADPGTTVEQVQAQARKVVQADDSSERDVNSAAYLVQLIKDYQKK